MLLCLPSGNYSRRVEFLNHSAALHIKPLYIPPPPAPNPLKPSLFTPAVGKMSNKKGESNLSALKDYVFCPPPKEESSVYRLEWVLARPRLRLIAPEYPVSQRFVMYFIILVTPQSVVIGSDPACPLPPLCFVPSQCRKFVFSLGECNLFLMDNMTLSGAGSRVS